MVSKKFEEIVKKEIAALMSDGIKFFKQGQYELSDQIFSKLARKSHLPQYGFINFGIEIEVYSFFSSGMHNWQKNLLSTAHSELLAGIEEMKAHPGRFKSLDVAFFELVLDMIVFDLKIEETITKCSEVKQLLFSLAWFITELNVLFEREEKIDSKNKPFETLFLLEIKKTFIDFLFTTIVSRPNEDWQKKKEICKTSILKCNLRREYAENFVSRISGFGTKLWQTIEEEDKSACYEITKEAQRQLIMLLNPVSTLSTEQSFQISARQISYQLLPYFNRIQDEIKRLKRGADEESKLTKHYKLKQENKIYRIYTFHQSGIGVDNEEATERELKTKYLRNKKRYDIFIYDRTVEKKERIKIDGKQKENIISIDLDENILRLLVLFLKYKNTHLSYMKLYNKAWEESATHDRNAIPREIINNLKTAVSTLRATFEDIKEFYIPPARAGGYTCKGNFKFCLVLRKSKDQWYTLEEA